MLILLHHLSIFPTFPENVRKFFVIFQILDIFAGTAEMVYIPSGHNQYICECVIQLCASFRGFRDKFPHQVETCYTDCFQ